MTLHQNLIQMFADAVRRDDHKRIDALSCAIGSRLDPVMPFSQLMLTKAFHDWALLYAASAATTQPHNQRVTCEACREATLTSDATLISRTFMDGRTEHLWECDSCGSLNPLLDDEE